MKKHIVFPLLLLFLLSACGETAAPQEPALTKQATLETVGTNMVISMPEDWSYTEFLITGGDDGTSAPIRGFSIYPDADPEAVVEITAGGYYPVDCGPASLTTNVTYANGYQGVLYYDDYEDSSRYRIAFPAIPGIYSVNYFYSNAQMNAYANTVDDILDHLVFADGIIGENAAMLIAMQYKSADDETLRAEYDPAAGTWQVGIYPHYGGPTPHRTLTLDKTGKVLTVSEHKEGEAP